MVIKTQFVSRIISKQYCVVCYPNEVYWHTTFEKDYLGVFDVGSIAILPILICSFSGGALSFSAHDSS